MSRQRVVFCEGLAADGLGGPRGVSEGRAGMKLPPEEAHLAFVEALVALSAMDLPYSDLYLDRAEARLGQVLSEERYRALCRDRDRLPGLAREVRRLAEGGEWSKVRALAHQGVRNRQRIKDNERILPLGDAVYGPRVFHADATALALSGIIVQPMAHLARKRDECVAGLRFVLANDDGMAQFYCARLAHLEGLEIVADETGAPVVTAADLQHRLLKAAEQGDFYQAERLSAAILEMVPGNRPAVVRAPRPGASLGLIAAEFPERAVRRARELGLAAVTLTMDKTLNDYVSVGGAARLVFPDAPLTEGDPPRADGSTADRDDHTPISGKLREVLDLLMLHPFVTSAGTRYLPWFGAETLLVETFPETEPEARTGLLDALALRSRRGVSRLTIEGAVRRKTGRICADLGLDPAAYLVVPIPFDAYLRLAPRYNWGWQRRWTHFDGYQVTRELHFRALVGGDVSYGGAEDLCGVARDYEVERIVARFAIVCRERFVPYEPADDRAGSRR